MFTHTAAGIHIPVTVAGIVVQCAGAASSTVAGSFGFRWQGDADNARMAGLGETISSLP